MLNVSYRNRIGYYTKIEKDLDGNDRKYKNWICHANCLWAEMYFYKVDEDYERYGKHYKKGDKMAQLICFFSDNKHLKTCIERDIYYGCDDFHFFADQMTPEMWTSVKLIINAGKKVTIVKSQKKARK